MTKHFATAALAAILLAATGVGCAQAQQAAAAPAAKPAPVSKFLAPGDLDPALIVPPPAGDGSAFAAAELAELHRIAATSSPERLARAKHDDEIEDVRSIADVLPGFDLAKLPATAQLFKDLRNEDSVAAKRAKTFFARTRPWAADTTLHPCPNDDAVKSSYPSGHSTMGYAAAAVLANLVPSKAQTILARSSDYAESRLVCGAHYRSDTEAGHVLATAMVDKLMGKSDFQRELEAARAELTSAHIAP
jgi:acid phosphatase (class A)